MTAFVVDLLLAIVVASVWLGCLGFVRLRDALDRQHCVAFVAATAGVALMAAGFVSDGISGRSLKILLVVAATLLTGSATSQALGRALLRRHSEPDIEADMARQAPRP